MSLVDEREILIPALAKRRAIGAFNANNMEMVQAYVMAAEEMQLKLKRDVDLIIQLSPGASVYAGWELGAGMVKIAAENTTVDIALNLDHGTEFEHVQKALDNGFTAVLFDGSDLPFEENIKETRKYVEICHGRGVPVEAELGKIPKIEDWFTKEDISLLRTLTAYEAVNIIRRKAAADVERLMAKPDDVEKFVEETGCDFLAAAFGSIHGIWDDIWPIRVDRLREIQQRREIPLVSHGSSGILMRPTDAKNKGIELALGEGTLLDAIQTGGVTKVNVATVLSVRFIQGFVDAYNANHGEKDFRKLGVPARERVKNQVMEYIQLFEGEVA